MCGANHISGSPYHLLIRHCWRTRGNFLRCLLVLYCSSCWHRHLCFYDFLLKRASVGLAYRSIRSVGLEKLKGWFTIFLFFIGTRYEMYEFLSCLKVTEAVNLDDSFLTLQTRGFIQILLSRVLCKFPPFPLFSLFHSSSLLPSSPFLSLLPTSYSRHVPTSSKIPLPYILSLNTSLLLF